MDCGNDKRATPWMCLGAWELVRELWAADSDHWINGMLRGLASGSVLGYLQGVGRKQQEMSYVQFSSTTVISILWFLLLTYAYCVLIQSDNVYYVSFSLPSAYIPSKDGFLWWAHTQCPLLLVSLPYNPSQIHECKLNVDWMSKLSAYGILIYANCRNLQCLVWVTFVILGQCERLLSFRNLVGFLHLGVDFLYGQVRISSFMNIFTFLFLFWFCVQIVVVFHYVLFFSFIFVIIFYFS